jgi:hypothetical protein
LLSIGKRLDARQELEGKETQWLKPGVPWNVTVRDGFIQRNLMIRTKSRHRAEMKLNRAQREYSAVCLEHKANRNIVLKARQVGITTYVAARFFVQTITQPGTFSMQVTRDRQSAEDIFRIVRRFWDNLPEEARKGVLKTSRSNVRQLIFPKIDSEYCLAAAAEDAGRGRTIQNLHCSEVSRWGRKGDEALASLRAAVVPDGDIVLESTPNGAGGLFYDEWQRAEETGYQRHFFPWWFDEAYVLEPEPGFSLTEEEAALAAAHDLSWEQLAWRRKQWAALRGMAEQEYAEDAVSCFRASGECVFDLESLEQARAAASAAVETRDNGRLLIWMPNQAGRDYVLGADPAGGGPRGDYSCAEVIDRRTGAQCAEFVGHINPRGFAKTLADLGGEYNTALVAVESNNHGHAVLACLENRGYPRIYKQGDEYGWCTTAVSRPAMIENLVDALITEPRLFQSERLLKECRTFVRFSSGRTSGAPGTHDDCVMAMGIAWAVRKADAGRVRLPEFRFTTLEK